MEDGTTNLEPAPQFDDSTPPVFVPVRGTDFPWRYAGVLTVASIIGCILVVPFTAALMKQMKELPQIVIDAMPLVMAVQVVIESVLSMLMIALGLGLGRSLGLVWPPLDGWDAGPDRAQRMRSAILLATGLGIIAAALMLGLGYGLRGGGGEGKVAVELPNWWDCLIASVGAGIREEVWLRLGLMTFFVWVITKLGRRTAPADGAIWTANVAASLVFGAIHLPQAFAFLGSGIGLIAFVLLGNGIPGVMFGWLFWRKGLIAAMVSHAVFDIVTKVIIPLATG
jgi:membrane protease YdiL (CAAX protease family)